MLEFRSPKLSDYSSFAPFFYDEGELSCEMNFISIYIWQKIYENKFYMDEKTLFFKSVTDDGEGVVFSLPYGDLDYGMGLIFDYCKEKGIKPNLWTSKGKRLDSFLKKYCNYEMRAERDNFDYIYNRMDLAELSGKKYHSKRNHISAFSKKYDWSYHAITKENIDEVLRFADKWYSDRGEETDKGLLAEHEALKEILKTDIDLKAIGGFIRVEGKIVAFTVGSPINSYTFDIHYEKADTEYQTAYALINREFVLNELKDFKYVNREDDLGLEGLRKAKLSYKPEILLEKYSLIYAGDDFEV